MREESQQLAAPAYRRILAQGAYETISVLKNAEQLMVSLAFPLMALGSLTFTSFLDPWAQEAGVQRVDIALPGVLALCLLSTALTGQGIATGFDRRYGALQFLATTPLGSKGLIAGKLLAVLAVLALQYLLVGLSALALGWQPQLTGILLSLPTLLLGALAFTSLALLIAGTVRAEATLAIVNMAWALLAAAGGILIPTDRYPSWLGPLVDLLPSAALGNALRADLISQTFLPLPHLILLLAALIFGALASKHFKWSA